MAGDLHSDARNARGEIRWAVVMFREAVVLRDIEGREYREIAALTDTPNGTNAALGKWRSIHSLAQSIIHTLIGPLAHCRIAPFPCANQQSRRSRSGFAPEQGQQKTRGGERDDDRPRLAVEPRGEQRAADGRAHGERRCNHQHLGQVA